MSPLGWFLLLCSGGVVLVCAAVAVDPVAVDVRAKAEKDLPRLVLSLALVWVVMAIGRWLVFH